MKFQLTDAHMAIKMSVLPSQYIKPLLTDPIALEGIIVDAQETTKEDKRITLPYPVVSIANILLTDRYLTEILKTEGKFSFFYKLISFIKPLVEKLNLPLPDESSRFSRFGAFNTISIFYTADEKNSFGFIVDLKVVDEHLDTVLSGLIATILDFKKKKGPVYQKIKGVKPQNDGIKYFQYSTQGGFWIVLNPIKDICDRHSEEYRKQRDKRVHKPNIILNEDNYLQHFIWDKQWDLHMDGVRIIIPRPNDVAIYAKIALEQLASAKRFYEKEIKGRKEYFGQTLLSFEEAAIFYDYFEKIIAAIIFSYTAIEAFANSCVVDDYTYIEEKEKEGRTIIHSKKAIERYMSLSDKLKIVLPEILKAPSPSGKDWWSTLMELEQIRNEIIHTKQIDSKERYSKLLQPGIFKRIEIFDSVIKYYGPYILESKYSLINEYPYDFGNDGVMPSFMTNEDYISASKNLRGIK